jgi:ABC-type transport system involved in cytochrome c biogenesis permease subunit
MPSVDAQGVRPPLAAAVWDVALNAIVPVILYKLSKQYLPSSELMALLVATTFPVGKSIFDLARRGQLDPVSVVVLLGIAANGGALFFGGSARLLLLRESLFTGAFGLACFLSLLLPRPMMFYFARHFMVGADPQRRARFNAGWQVREIRFCHRLITVVWGCVFVGELILRVVLIDHASTATVLIVSPALLGTLTIAAMIWAFGYGRRVRLRAQAQLDQISGPDAPTAVSDKPI